MQFYAPDPNPDYDAVDLRALAEKRAARAALDAEWKAREALLAKPFSYTLRCAGVCYDIKHCVCWGGWLLGPEKKSLTSQGF